jgi:hypothetical protein
MIFWSLDCLLWSSNLLERTGGCRTLSTILFEIRQRFTGFHVHDRHAPSLPEEWEWLRRLSSAVERPILRIRWRLTTNGEGRPIHNFRGINTCAGACVSPHIQPVPQTQKIHQQPTQYPRLLFQSPVTSSATQTAKCVVESRIYCSRFEAAAFLCSLDWGNCALCVAF